MRVKPVLGACLATVLCFATESRAADVPIRGLKLIVVDNTIVGGRAKATFVTKDPNVMKGTGTDAEQITAILYVAYDNVRGAFSMSQGENWLVNSDSVAKYVNKTAPTGGATKVGIIRPGKMAKTVARSLGDTPLDISSPPSGTVFVTETIHNGGQETRLCTSFSDCVHVPIAGGAGHKLVCKSSSGDPSCLASPKPACAGAPVGGACWFTATSAVDCNAVCASQGLVYDPATATFAGSAGSDANCSAVAIAAGFLPLFASLPGCSDEIVSFCCSVGLGCYYFPGLFGESTIRCQGPPTTATATDGVDRPFCACM